MYPVSRIDALMGEGISEILAHFCNLVMDSHMVKVTSCLAGKHSECGRAG